MGEQSASSAGEEAAVTEKGSAQQGREWVLRHVSENPGLLATVGYLYLTAVGIVYSVFLYREFGISIVEFSQPTDFLLAGLREPVLFVFSLLSFQVLRRLSMRDRKMRDRYNSYRSLAQKVEASRWYSGWVVSALVIFTYFAAATLLYAKFVAAGIRSGRGRAVTVMLNSDPNALHSIGADGDVRLIGTTGQYFFLYRLPTARTLVVPTASVAHLTFHRIPPAANTSGTSEPSSAGGAAR